MMRKFAFALGVTTCCSQVHSAYAVKNTNVLDDMPRGSIRKNVFDRSGVLHESRVRNNLLKPEMIPHNFPLFLKMTFPKLIADLKKLNKPKNKKLSRSSSSKISFNHNTPLANKKSIKRKIRAKAKEERKKKRKAALAAKKKRITKIRLKKQKEIKKINERVSRKKARANYIRTKKNRVSRKKTTLDNNIDMRVLLSTLRKKGMLASLFKPHTTHSNPPKSKVSDQKNSPQSLNRRIPHEKKPQNSSKLAAKSTSEVKRITLPTKPLETPFKETRKSVSSVPSPIKKVDQEKQGTISPSKLPKIVKTPTQIQPAFKAMTQIKALKEAIKELEKTSSVCDLDMTNKTRSYLKGTKNLNSSNLAHTLASLYESEQVITRQQVAIENLEPGPLAKQPTVFDITPEPTLAINEEAIPTLKKTSPPETPQVIVSSNDHVLSKQITGLYFQNPNIDLETAETSNYLIQTPPKVSWENDSIEKDIASIQRTDLETSPPSQEDKASSRDHVVIANLESIPQEKSTFHVVAKVFDNLTPITKISTLTAPNRTHEQKSREEKGTPIAESIPSITKENDFKEAVMSLVHESSMDELKIIAENSSQFTSNDEIESKAKIIKYSTHNAQTNKRPDTSNMALKIGEELIPSVSSVVSELVGIERTWIEEGIVRIGTHVKPTEPQDIEFHRVIVQPEK
ncbi:MAG: hypothetical protein K2P93_06225, partial [Alphaproteobacteria bacterium]|nr:hypothetical protein [Alphaproteobacteria bacterium]